MIRPPANRCNRCTPGVGTPSIRRLWRASLAGALPMSVDQARRGGLVRTGSRRSRPRLPLCRCMEEASVRACLGLVKVLAGRDIVSASCCDERRHASGLAPLCGAHACCWRQEEQRAHGKARGKRGGGVAPAGAEGGESRASAGECRKEPGGKRRKTASAGGQRGEFPAVPYRSWTGPVVWGCLLGQSLVPLPVCRKFNHVCARIGTKFACVSVRDSCF